MDISSKPVPGKYSDRIPSLDGARTVSAFLVIIWHIFAAVPILWRFDYGNLGVRTFFVISGFLITSILMRELERTGGISLWTFYARRFLRLMPAYWFYVVVIALLIPTGRVVASYHQLAPVLTYTSNYWRTLGIFGHTWSLSTEEQFYFLWPVALLLLGLSRAWLATVAMIIAAPIFRVLADAHYWPVDSKVTFECVCDAMAVGCALALLRQQLWDNERYQRLALSAWPWVAVAGVMVIIAFRPHFLFKDLIGLPVLNVSLAMLLDRYMRFPAQGFGRLLNARPMVWVGTLSYSVYLWQQLWTGFVLPISLELLFTLLSAMVSYYAIELPFMTLRSRLNLKRPSLVPQPAR